MLVPPTVDLRSVRKSSRLPPGHNSLTPGCRRYVSFCCSHCDVMVVPSALLRSSCKRVLRSQCSLMARRSAYSHTKKTLIVLYSIHHEDLLYFPCLDARPLQPRRIRWDSRHSPQTHHRQASSMVQHRHGRSRPSRHRRSIKRERYQDDSSTN